MISESDQEPFYKLLANATNVDQLRELLRCAKDAEPGEFKLSGTKESLVNQLQKAVVRGHILESALIDFLRDHEESGNQYIFYFVPTGVAEASVIGDHMRLGNELLGMDWEAERQFPRFLEMPEQPTWADLRSDQDGNSGIQSWTLKWYEPKTTRSLISSSPDGDCIVERYRVERHRLVFVVKWHADQVLEIRLPRAISSTDSKVALRRSLEHVWHMLGVSLPAEWFAPWDLKPAMRRLHSDRANNQKQYKIEATLYLDPQMGTVSFASPPDEDVYSDPMRAAALQACQVRGLCTDLCVQWLPTSGTQALKAPLDTRIGVYFDNCLLVPGRTTGRALDYVRYRLRDFIG